MFDVKFTRLGETDSYRSGAFPHVLVVSNHWEAQEKILSFAGVFVDSQIVSLQNLGVKVSTFDIGIGHSPFNLVRKWKDLKIEIDKLKPDLIHAQFGTTVAMLCVFSGQPVVLSFFGPDLLKRDIISSPRWVIGHLLSNLSVLRGQGIICVSEQLRQALWWRRNKAMVIPHGVNLELFSPGSQIEARKKLSWGLTHPVIVISVRNDPKGKGLDLAKSSMKVVRTILPDVELKVITNVLHDRMPLYFRAADVLFCGSKSEGSPNVVKEALACNLPVVSVPVGDVVERLVGVYPSAIVPRDPDEIGKALADILKKRKRSNGRDKVGHLSLDKIARRVLGVYQMVLDGKNYR